MGFNLARSIARARARAQPGALFDLGRLGQTPRPANEAAIRALADNAYLGDGTALCRVLGRYKLFVDTQDVGLSSHLLLDGYWEMWTTEVIARRVRRGMTVADVGANLGYFSVLMAELVGPEGAVHAFEPNPAIAERLARSLAVNGYDARSHVHVAPLSDRDGDLVRLIVPEREPKNAHMVACSPHMAETLVDPILLRTRRLDSYPELAAADFVKIDADTAEEAIWSGMTGLLQRGRPLTVILEFSPTRYTDPRGFLAAIAAQGFSLVLIDRGEGERAATPDQILAGPPLEDRMLLLCR